MLAPSLLVKEYSLSCLGSPVEAWRVDAAFGDRTCEANNMIAINPIAIVKITPSPTLYAFSVMILYSECGYINEGTSVLSRLYRTSQQFFCLCFRFRYNIKGLTPCISGAATLRS